MRTLLIALPLLEAGLILFLVLRKPSGKRPNTALKVFGFLAIGGGIAWLWFWSPLRFGWLGPFWFIRIWRDALSHPANSNFWGLLNPLMYGGVIAVALIAGGAGLLRVRRWARGLFLYLAAAAAIMAMISFIKFRSRMEDSLKLETFLCIVAALVIVIFFMQKPIMQMFSEEIAEPESPPRTEK